MVSKIEIGEPVRGDTAALRRLVRGFIDFHRGIASEVESSESEVSQSLGAWRRSRHRSFFVIRSAGRLVGFMVLKKDPTDPVYWGEELYIDPGFRGKGVARRSLEFAEWFVKSKGGDALYLWVAASNRNALRVFRALGYQTLNMVELRKDLRSSRARGARWTGVSMWGLRLRVRRPTATNA